MKEIKLITRADDAGLNRTVNKAIRSSVKQGIARNISLLAPAPAIVHAAECFADLDKDVDFGLQVCLTAEWENVRWGPVAGAAQVPSIVRDDGTFHYTLRDLEQANPAIDEIMAEVKAQYDTLIALGFDLAYLVVTREFDGIPGLRKELTAFCKTNGLLTAGGSGGEVPDEPLPGWSGPGEHPGTELADHLATAQSGTYLVVGRPAFKTDEIEYLKRPGQPKREALLSRNRERRMFADIEIVDYCENGGIEPVRYSRFKK
ncbi:MAG: ChbG/HpnK family deacetylase [Spirochaetales bacterium]|nr:ChbG/HpnK family deacetylase [Spirochaetales bacterium]